MPSLWPDDIAAAGDAAVQPVHILREQAAHLGQMTNGLVIGLVNTYPSAENFIHTFSLLCPSLDNYTFKLFDVNHRLDGYPVTIIAPIDAARSPGPSFREIPCQNEREFADHLREVLASPRVKHVVKALLTQVQDVVKKPWRKNGASEFDRGS
jgi:hypothetical protein